MKQYRPILDWIDQQHHSMLDLVIKWSKINSHTFNLDGLRILSREIVKSFRALKANIDIINLPPVELITKKGEKKFHPLGQAIKISKRSFAPHQIFLVCHMDTVYPRNTTKYVTKLMRKNILRGPGVTDAKGGIVVLLKTLEALERSPFKEEIGWQVLINPDEEIGSPGSKKILKQSAQRNHFGLVFEPCLPNGYLVGERKGSGNFTIIVKGRSAHAGRDPHLGRNAINVLAKCVVKINALNNIRPGLTVNVGVIEGGQAINVVPDLAIAKFNVRIKSLKDWEFISEKLNNIILKFSKMNGISIKLHRGGFISPKNFDDKTQNLFNNVKQCAKEVGFDIHWRPTGGVCDGNRLAAFGLPNVDTMGVRGGDIHSPNEYLYVDSLTQRAKLTALFLMKLGAGEFPKWQRR